MNRITNHRKTFLDILIELKENQITSIVPTFRPLVGYLYNDISVENLESQINILEELYRLGICYREIKVSTLQCRPVYAMNLSHISLAHYVRQLK